LRGCHPFSSLPISQIPSRCIAQVQSTIGTKVKLGDDEERGWDLVHIGSAYELSSQISMLSLFGISSYISKYISIKLIISSGVNVNSRISRSRVRDPVFVLFGIQSRA
jgi:hypothetical protein